MYYTDDVVDFETPIHAFDSALQFEMPWYGRKC